MKLLDLLIAICFLASILMIVGVLVGCAMPIKASGAVYGDHLGSVAVRTTVPIEWGKASVVRASD